jgi:hypothetical protein
MGDVFDVTNLENSSEYYSVSIESTDFNLYRNINLILYLENDFKGTDTSEESIRRNT